MHLEIKNLKLYIIGFNYYEDKFENFSISRFSFINLKSFNLQSSFAQMFWNQAAQFFGSNN